MASYRDTVKACLLRYPTLFQEAFDVGHHLFLVIGNGYGWEEGELVESGASLPIDQDRVVQEQRGKMRAERSYLAARALAMGGDPQARALARERDERAMRYEFTVAHIDAAVALRRAPGPGGLYPLSPDYAKLFTFPDDACPDWLAGMRDFCEDCLSMLEANAAGGPPSREDKPYAKAIAQAKARAEALLEPVGAGPTQTGHALARPPC